MSHRAAKALLICLGATRCRERGKPTIQRSSDKRSADQLRLRYSNTGCTRAKLGNIGSPWEESEESVFFQGDAGEAFVQQGKACVEVSAE